MATFAKSTFNAVRYAAARPTYPRQLFDFVFRFHERGRGARWEQALDLGCGTGQATLELTPFAHIVGADPSAKMIEQATAGLRVHTQQGYPDLAERVRFVQSPAEELGWMDSESVDLIVSAQAAHWFDWARLWPEAARVLRSGGSLAAWGYSEFRLAEHPRATPLIHAYSQGTDPAASLGPHWERPGRTIVDNHLLDIPDPRTLAAGGGAWADFERVFFTGGHHPHLPAPLPVLLRKRTSWGGLLSYLRTFSALHTFHERYPADLANPDGDIAVRFYRKLKAQVAEDEGKGRTGDEVGDEEEVEIEWPLAIILARKA
ncbi:hypothetical protein AcV7_005320 [Taiwanofungus camphoratus]|nr:hypothetical protein AcV7_005320 [Antrodia cinnamomea]